MCSFTAIAWCMFSFVIRNERGTHGFKRGTHKLFQALCQLHETISGVLRLIILRVSCPWRKMIRLELLEEDDPSRAPLAFCSSITQLQ